MSDFKCGELYEEGNCEGCGMPQAQCPSWTGSTVEFLGSGGQVLTSSVMDGDQQTAEGMVTMLWTLMPQVWAVRFTMGGAKPSRKVLRRPTTTAVAPRVGPNPIRTAQQARRVW